MAHAKRQKPAPRPAKGRPRSSGGSRRPKAPVDVRWENLRPLYDFWGDRIPRYYGLDSLTRAVEGLLHGNDKFIVPSVQALAGPSAVTSLRFELFQEGQYQLIFRMKAMNERRKLVSLGFVAAKRPGDFSKLAAQEHENLRMLNARAPDHVVRPFQGGRVILQDRRLGPGRNWDIYAYLTQWLGSYHEMGVTRTLQFYVNVKQPLFFSAAQTEQIKGQIVETIARTYDPEKRECIEMPQIASGDFVVTKPSQSKPRVKLIACRRLLRNMTPARVIRRIVEAHWDWGGRDFRLAPEDPQTILQGLERALGKDGARAWLRDYRDQLDKGTFPELEPLTKSALGALGLGR